jgi:hypothetical protein
MRSKIFESKILRRIYGPADENDLERRQRQDKELSELLDGPDIVKCMNFTA